MFVARSTATAEGPGWTGGQQHHPRGSGKPAAWAAADRTVTYDAPWVILANLNNVDFLAARLANYQCNPFMGVLLDQLPIRQHPQVRGYPPLPPRPSLTP